MPEATILKCKECKGSGRARLRSCTNCGGAGKLRRVIADPVDYSRQLAGQIARWETEIERLGRRIDKWNKKRETLQNLITSARKGLAPKDIAAVKPIAPPGEKKTPKADKMLTPAIRSIVLASDRPLPQHELHAELMKTKFAGRITKTRNSFYNGISTLSDRGEIVRYKRHLFAPEVFAKFKADLAAGAVLDLKTPGGRWPAKRGE
jgi:hypothetical protein